MMLLYWQTTTSSSPRSRISLSLPTIVGSSSRMASEVSERLQRW